MTIHLLDASLAFPDPSLAEPEGLLAIGGDLSPERLMLAYHQGIFPWFSPGHPPLWWSPDPRMLLIPGEMRIAKSLLRVLKSAQVQVTLDTCFHRVIRACSTTPRPGQDGTWITRDMIKAYETLHALGYAHSFEVWYGEELAGGLYGVSQGACFFGESMFSHQRDASKVAFAWMEQLALHWGLAMIDCQLPTNHLTSLGARPLPRSEFLAMLAQSNLTPTRQGSWAGALTGLPGF